MGLFLALPTDIWTNLDEWIPKTCRNGNTDHAAAPRGAKTGTQGRNGATERGRVPHCVELLNQIDLEVFR